MPENPPTLTQFKQQVDKYEKIYLEVDKFEVSPSSGYINIFVAIGHGKVLPREKTFSDW